MKSRPLDFDYSSILHASGLPFRLQDTKKFELNRSLSSFQITDEMVHSTKKQQEQFTIACEDPETGWLMYVCAEGVVDKAKQVAANVMQSYHDRNLNTRWLTNFDKIDKISFHTLQLVVIDTLFFDSAPYRRDKIYEVINYNCNVEKLSVLVIAQNSSPVAVAEQLGMRPDLMMLMK